MSTTFSQGTQGSLSSGTTKEGAYSSTVSGKDQYGSTFNKSGLEGQQNLGSSSLVKGSSLSSNLQSSQLGSASSSLNAFKYSGNIQFGAIPNSVTSSYSVQRFDASQVGSDQQAVANQKVLWAATTKEPITMQHKSFCVQQEPLMIKPEPIVVPQPPVVFQPDAIQIAQPPLMFQPEPIAIPLPPLTIQPEPVVIERPPLVIQPEPVLLRRPDIQMNPSFALSLKYSSSGVAEATTGANASTTQSSSAGLASASTVGSGAVNQPNLSGASTTYGADKSIGNAVKNAALYESAALTGSSGGGGSTFSTRKS